MRIFYDYVNYHYLLAAIKKSPSGCQRSKTWIFFPLLGLKPLYSASVLIILINIPVAPRRGYSGFQVTGMTEWGQKSKPKKVLWASNKTKKMPGPKLQNFQAIKMSRQHQIIELSQILRLFWIPQKIPTLIKLQKKYILLQKSWNKKFQPHHPLPKKKSFDHPCHLKSGVPPGR